MGWIDNPQPLGPKATSPEHEDTGYLDALKPAFETENTIGSFLTREEGSSPVADPDSDYDPISAMPEDIPKEYAKSYAFANNQDDVDAITRQVKKEVANRQKLADAGWLGVAAGFTAGVLDPVNLIPIGGSAYKSYRVGGSILQNGLITARAGFIGASAAEVALHATQETRTWGESAANVAAATFLSGVLGGAVGAISANSAPARATRRFEDLASRVEDDLTVPKPTEPDPMVPGSLGDETVEISTLNPEGGSAGAAAVENYTTKAQESLANALGVDKAVAFQDPVMRTLTSAALTARRLIQRVAENPMAMAKNAEGIASDVAVETRVKMHETSLWQGFESMDDAFVRYRTGRSDMRAARLRIGIKDIISRSDKLTYDDFKTEVARAMRRGDKHDIPEVAEAAKHLRETVFNPLRDQAIAAKLLPEDVGVTTAESYLSRVYNIERMGTHRTEFLQVTANWLRSKNADALDEELQDIAGQIWSRIIGTPDGRMPYDVDVSELKPRKGKSGGAVRGPLKTRSFDIPDELIEDFLENDIEMISRMYVRSMAPDVELTKAFGDVQMTEAIKEVDAEWGRIISAAPEADRSALLKKRDADIRDLAAVRDRVRHTYGVPENPNGLAVRTFRVARSLNYMRLLGGMTLSAFPDAARPVMVHGLGRVFRDGIVPLVRGLGDYSKVKAAAREVKLAGTALDMVLDTRTMSIADIADNFGRRSKFERGIQAATDKFGLVSLMAPWNAAMKQFSGIVTMTRMLDAADAVTAGKISEKELGKLAQQGISPAMAKRIARQFAAHGETADGVKMANTEAWTDAGAREAFQAGLVKEVDKIIVTPGQDKPLWMSTELGKVIGQFKSFSIASTQRTLIAGLQQRDMATLNGAMLMVGLGMLTYTTKEKLAGRDVASFTEDPDVWLTEGFDRSGLLGWFFEANNMAEKVTRGTIGVSALTGGPQMSRYASRNITGALLGPTVGLTQDFVQTTGSAFSGDWQSQDTRALRRLLPYQNLFYLRSVLDAAEEGVNDALGAPN